MKRCDNCDERITAGKYLTIKKDYHFCSDSCFKNWERKNEK
jgi:hypothetical protein